MGRIGLRRQRFAYAHRQGARTIPFDVVFLIDTQPWQLLFGARVQRPIAILFDVRSDFSVRAYLDAAEYAALCSVLGLRYDPANRFSPASFLTDFEGSGQIPRDATMAAVPEPHDVPRPEKHVSDHDKPFFWHWRPNLPGRRVSAENLKRTALCFGDRYSRYCEAKNISSCWTADRDRAMRAEPPPGFA